MNIMRFMIPKSLVSFLTVDHTVRQALEKMRFHRYTAMPVIDREGLYVGTVRTDDLLSYFFDSGSFDARDGERAPIDAVMDTDISRAVRHTATLRDLIEKVKEHNFVPVVDDRGCFIGIVLRRDILNFLLEHCQDIPEIDEKVKEDSSWTNR